jgi:transposase
MAHAAPPRVTIGVDTHKDLHVAAARDQLGRRLGTTSALGQVEAWGVEGTGSYGAGLARFLAARG